MSIEKRKHPRHETDFFVRATVVATEGAHVGTCRNLSMGGAFIDMEHPLARGTEIKLAIRIERTGDVLLAEARVVRTQSAVDPSLQAGIGVEFVDLDDEARELLTRVLEDLGTDVG